MENFRPINLHQTRDFSRKMNATIEFIRQNFKSLAKSILFIAGPPVIIASLFLGSFMADMFTASFNMGRSGDSLAFANQFLEPSFWLQIVMMFIFLILSFAANISTINNYVKLYEERQSNEIAVSDVWERVRQSLGMYIGSMILYTILFIVLYVVVIVVVGLMAVITPVLAVLGGAVAFWGFMYLFVGTSLLFFIRSYEDIGFFDAIFRSLKLTSGKWWSTFGLLMVLSLIAGVISYIFMIPWYAVTIVSALHSTGAEGFEEPSQIMQIFSTVLFALYYMAQVLLQSMPQLGIAFQYFNLVERKEARGLMSQIESIGEVPTSTPGQEEHY
jgi:hypothetical protein